jgi:hypothetical protein
VLVAGALAVLTASPSQADTARAQFQVHVRVVQPARIEVASTDTLRVESLAVSGGREWRAGPTVKAWVNGAPQAAGVTFRAIDCDDGSRNARAAGGAEQGARIFIPSDSGCAPVLIATVFPDGSPP